MKAKKKIKKKTNTLINKENNDTSKKLSNFDKFEYFNEDLPEENDEQFVSLEKLQEEENNEENDTN